MNKAAKTVFKFLCECSLNFFSGALEKRDME